MPIEQLNGIDLYYESNGEGPPVVFLHGAGGNHISWWQQVPAFRDRYRCITIDHRGFGRSTDPKSEGASRYVDDLETLLDKLGVERVGVVAQSMGGRTALGFAVRHPDRVAALAMCDTWGFFDWPELRERQEALRAGAANAPLTSRALGPKYQQEHPRGTFLYQQISGLNPPRNEGAATASDGPTKAQVEAMTVPTLFLVGSVDALVSPEIMRSVHEIVPGSEYAEVADAGHSVYFENAPEFNRIVGDFLGKHV
jgi:3-oxoadipate enol-lactonase